MPEDDRREDLDLPPDLKRLDRLIREAMKDPETREKVRQVLEKQNREGVS